MAFSDEEGKGGGRPPFRLAGTVCMLLASASFTTMAAMIKAVGPGVGLVQLVFLRCLLAAPLLLVFILARKRPLVVRAKGVLLVRALFGITAMHGFFYALTHLPLAEAVFIGRAQPLLVALLAPLLLGDRVPRAAWVAIGTGMAGVALIMKPALAWSNAAWVALGAAGCAAVAQILVRRLNRTDYPLVIVFNFTCLTALVTGLWALPRFTPLSGRQWLLVAGIALFASLGQLLMTLAYRRDTAPAVAASAYSSIVLSVAYGFFIWGEVPDPLAIGGAILVLAGGFFLVRSRLAVTVTP